MGNKSAGKAPHSIKMGSAGGGKASVGLLPQDTITGPGDEGKKALGKRSPAKEYHEPKKGAESGGEQDVSSTYGCITKALKSGKTDF